MSFAAHDDTEEADCYIEECVQETGWRPGMVGIFAGTLRYTQCGFMKRYVMKRIARHKNNLDTSRDSVYAEWESVKHFAEESPRPLISPELSDAVGYLPGTSVNKLPVDMPGTAGWHHA